ncbi:D-alanyl-D-alanine carboxypeptidase family protein [Arthrobacter sp. ISL-65]|uniref:M15 family metallopeptidase n=1 Tax=Arthrobacter sp. ISL-65 TaxID=2819112 RepID=UPI001BEB0769|nr:M15 family metallopeptidase [Arthrobacter sp. ISL-65]MBT2549160.1 M15 family metallopeptidase [Arthrobacter sp. ISL-65]
MCYNCPSEPFAEARPGDRPSRRAVARLLMAAAGLSALAACTPALAPEASGTTSAASGTASPAASGEASSPVPSGSGSTSTGASARTSGAASPTSSASAASSASASATAPSAAPTTTAAAAPPSAASRLPKQYSLTAPASPWVIVNKHRPLKPASYVPADLVQPRVALAVTGEAAQLNRTTAAAAERMFAAAAADGVTMTLASGYRSYATQTVTYNGYVSSQGRAAADTASARPGHSEHQTGWAFDIGDGGAACSFQPCFAEQPAAVWAKANGHRFGFVVRYPFTQHTITGYFYESWHLRYVGAEAATDMRKRGIATLEQYFGLEAAPGYR